MKLKDNESIVSNDCIDCIELIDSLMFYFTKTIFFINSYQRNNSCDIRRYFFSIYYLYEAVHTNNPYHNPYRNSMYKRPNIRHILLLIGCQLVLNQ